MISSGYEFCHLVTVIHAIYNKMRFCACIWSGFLAAGIGRSPCFGFFHEKLVITDNSDNFFITINSIVAEHFFVCNGSGMFYLFTHIFHKIQTGSHADHLLSNPTSALLDPFSVISLLFIISESR